MGIRESGCGFSYTIMLCVGFGSIVGTRIGSPGSYVDDVDDYRVPAFFLPKNHVFVVFNQDRRGTVVDVRVPGDEGSGGCSGFDVGYGMSQCIFYGSFRKVVPLL